MRVMKVRIASNRLRIKVMAQLHFKIFDCHLSGYLSKQLNCSISDCMRHFFHNFISRSSSLIISSLNKTTVFLHIVSALEQSPRQKFILSSKKLKYFGNYFNLHNFQIQKRIIGRGNCLRKYGTQYIRQLYLIVLYDVL